MLLLPFILFSISVSAQLNENNEAPPLSKAKPTYINDIALKDIFTDKSIPLSSFKGKVYFLSFFSIGCGFCKTMLGDLSCVKEKYPKQIEVLAVGLDGEIKRKRKYIKQAKINFSAVHTEKELVKRLGGVDATPMTFIIDSYGNLVDRYPGTLDCTDIISYLKKKKIIQDLK